MSKKHDHEAADQHAEHARKLDDDTYQKELARLQIELVKLQEWIKHKG
jgi:polyphosphate kinase 2 (PPK2 family)